MREHRLPGDIERTSMAIIARELAARGVAPEPEHAAVVRRVIHATADFDYARTLRDSRTSFVREARKAVKLRDLNHVVTVWGVFFENDTDAKFFVEKNLVSFAKIKVLPGAGVNLKTYDCSSNQEDDKDYILVAHSEAKGYDFKVIFNPSEKLLNAMSKYNKHEIYA